MGGSGLQEPGFDRVADDPFVSRETLAKLHILVDELRRWQTVVNLVAPQSLSAVWERHILDSLQLAKITVPPGDWVDLGAGGGFPGLVIAVLRTAHQRGRTHLIESDLKKCTFLRHVVYRLELDAEVHCQRVEVALRTWTTDVGVVSARAVASLDQLITWSGPLLLNGAIGVFPKGQTLADELVVAARKFVFSHEVLPSETDARSGIVVIYMRNEKTSVA